MWSSDECDNIKCCSLITEEIIKSLFIQARLSKVKIIKNIPTCLFRLAWSKCFHTKVVFSHVFAQNKSNKTRALWFVWWETCYILDSSRSGHPKVFLKQGVLKICSKFTREHPYRSLISMKLLCNFIEITLRHGCSPVNLQHISRQAVSEHLLLRILLGGCFCSSNMNKDICQSF